MLLFGCKGSGKTLLSHAIAHHAGAMWFDISPRNMDGKVVGAKATTTFLHNVSPSAVHVKHTIQLTKQDDMRGARTLSAAVALAGRLVRRHRPVHGSSLAAP